MNVRQYIGARYVPKFLGLWNETTQYEGLDVVDNGSGTSYIARKMVPAGTPLNNTEFWFVYGASSGAIIDLQNRMSAVEGDIASIQTDVAYRLYVSDFDDLNDAITEINNMGGGCIVINADVTLSDPVSINVPCMIISDSNNHTITLNADINVLSDDFKLSGVNFIVDGGSIVLGARTLNTGIVRYSIINNTFSSDSLTQQIAIKVIRATTGNIFGNMFYSDTENNGLIAIYHDQNNENDWFQNTAITNNTFRRIYSDLYIAGTVHPEYCGGIEFCNNNSIWTTKGIHIESSDHFVISNNIIDFAGAPIYLRSPNGIRLQDNYIYTNSENTVIDVMCNSFTEHVIISGNYIWNRIEYSSTNMTYGLKITTNNNYTIEDVVIDNNQFRNCYHCIQAACNINGFMIHSNGFKASNTGIFIDTTYAITKGHYYGNYTASDTSTAITGGEIGYVSNIFYVSRTVPMGTTEEVFSIPQNIVFTKITGMIVRMPDGNITASCSLKDSTHAGVVRFSSALPADTTFVVQISYMVDA